MAEEGLWFLGTYAKVLLDGERSEGRLGVIELLLPRGAAPPLHHHPQDETFYVLDGELTVWVVDDESLAAGEGTADGEPPAWVGAAARTIRAGGMVYAPAGVPHTFRVESDTARTLTLSTPAGIEGFIRGLAEPAEWPWLQPPPEGPRLPPEEIARVEAEFGMVRVGPPPPAADA